MDVIPEDVQVVRTDTHLEAKITVTFKEVVLVDAAEADVMPLIVSTVTRGHLLKAFDDNIAGTLKAAAAKALEGAKLNEQGFVEIPEKEPKRTRAQKKPKGKSPRRSKKTPTVTNRRRKPGAPTK